VAIAIDSADIEKIYIDKTLVGKLPDFVSEGMYIFSYILFNIISKNL